MQEQRVGAEAKIRGGMVRGRSKRRADAGAEGRSRG
jgi:hypothetical protein